MITNKYNIKPFTALIFAFFILPLAVLAQNEVGSDASLSVKAQLESNENGPIVKLLWGTKIISTFGYIIEEGGGDDITTLAVIDAPEVGEMSEGGVFIDEDVDYKQSYEYIITPFDTAGTYPPTYITVNIPDKDVCSNDQTEQGVFYFDPTKNQNSTTK